MLSSLACFNFRNSIKGCWLSVIAANVEANSAFKNETDKFVLRVYKKFEGSKRSSKAVNSRVPEGQAAPVSLVIAVSVLLNHTNIIYYGIPFLEFIKPGANPRRIDDRLV
jgi:hypothetical protein